MTHTEDIVVFSNSDNLLGESPRWHPIEQCLYWTDIEAGTIFHQMPGEHFPDTFHLHLKVGCLGFRKSGGLILATSDGFQVWSTTDSQLKLLGNPESGKPGARFNDGMVDARGRFWAGSMTEMDASSCLYRLDHDHSMHVMVTNVTISNGIGWNKENSLLYFTDSLKRIIWQYDYKLTTGDISNRRVFVNLVGPGVPDGLAVDVDGNIWSVQCGEGKILVFNPAGDQIDELIFPTRCITACTFGGKDLSNLFVTSSRILLDPSEQENKNLAGAVFRVKTESKGIPAFFYAG